MQKNDRFHRIYLDINGKIKGIAKQFFDKYKRYYRSICFDEKDLYQEAMIKFLYVIRKYPLKPDVEIKKITYSSIKRLFLNILRDSIIRTKDAQVMAHAEFKATYLDEEADPETGISKAEVELSKHAEIKRIEDALQEEFKDTAEHIKSILKPKEYDLLYKKVVEEKTFREIAKDYNRSPSSVHERYTRLINKIVNDCK